MSASLCGEIFRRFSAYFFSLALFLYFALLVLSRSGELVYLVIGVSFLMLFLLLYAKEYLFPALFLLLPLTFGLPLWFGSSYFSTAEVALLVIVILMLQLYPQRVSWYSRAGEKEGWIFGFLLMFFICSGFVSVLKGLSLLPGLEVGNLLQFQNEVVHIVRPLISLLEFFLVFFLLWSFRSAGRVSLLVSALVMATFLALCFGYGQYYYELPVLRSYEIRAFAEVGRLSSTFTDANSLGGYLLLVFPLLIAGFFFLKKWMRWLSLLSALLLLPVLYLTGCKAALCGVGVEVSLALLLPGSLLLFERKRGASVLRVMGFLRRYFSLFFIGMMFLAGWGGYSLLQQQNLVERYAETIKGKDLSYLYHLQSNDMALKLYREMGDPLFGMGPGTYFLHAAARSVEELQAVGRERAEYDLLGPKEDLPHNFYMEVLTEFGLFGFCSLFGGLFFLWGRGVLEALYVFLLNRHEKEYWQSESFLSFCALLSIAGYGCFILFQNHAIADMHILLACFFFFATLPWFMEGNPQYERSGTEENWDENLF